MHDEGGEHSWEKNEHTRAHSTIGNGSAGGSNDIIVIVVTWVVVVPILSNGYGGQERKNESGETHVFLETGNIGIRQSM